MRSTMANMSSAGMPSSSFPSRWARAIASTLAWYPRRSTILLIPGTSSVRHLRENLAAASLTLPEDAITELNAVGT
jgi:aryl-alcohol dehydrogenase-like predicted oxidoreductase